VSQSMPSLAAVLGEIPDPRAARGRRHPWRSLLLLVALGLLSGANSQRALARFGQHLPRAWRRRLGFDQAPSQPTLHRLLRTVEVTKVEALLTSWLPQLQAAWGRESTRWVDGIAVDGKTLRGARRLGAADAHLVSACATAAGTVLGQVAAPAVGHEVAVVGDLLAQLTLQERTVTFDAAFTQSAVAEQVVRQGGAYLMVVKGNQPTLKADIAAATARRGRCTGHAEQVTAAHGRIERRTLWVAPATAVRDQVLGWPHARQILALTRHVIQKRTGQVREETVYAVTSLCAEQADAAALLRLWQQHWGIENGVHWVRDVVFGEDRATTRSGHAPQVLAAFRNLALSLLRVWRGPAITAAREYYATHLGVLFRRVGL
jgi:predicted transposase YbfD/YdcC